MRGTWWAIYLSLCAERVWERISGCCYRSIVLVEILHSSRACINNTASYSSKYSTSTSSIISYTTPTKINTTSKNEIITSTLKLTQVIQSNNSIQTASEVTSRRSYPSTAGGNSCTSCNLFQRNQNKHLANCLIDRLYQEQSNHQAAS